MKFKLLYVSLLACASWTNHTHAAESTAEITRKYSEFNKSQIGKPVEELTCLTPGKTCLIRIGKPFMGFTAAHVIDHKINNHGMFKKIHAIFEVENGKAKSFQMFPFINPDYTKDNKHFLRAHLFGSRQDFRKALELHIHRAKATETDVIRTITKAGFYLDFKDINDEEVRLIFKKHIRSGNSYITKSGQNFHPNNGWTTNFIFKNNVLTDFYVVGTKR